MSEADLMVEIQRDLRTSTGDTVIYLEGKTDPAFLFALLGVPHPRDAVHRRVLVKGLKRGDGSGSTGVMARVALAGRFLPSKILGVIDGDGRSLDELAPHFDPGYSGPLFRWKSYCIENFMAKVGWPAAWGDEPDWTVELRAYGPYVALNRVGLRARSILGDLGIEKYANPTLSEPLWPSTEIAAVLAAGKAGLLAFDVEREYLDELANFEETIARDLDEAHTLINGKWLLRHLAPLRTSRRADLCEREWLDHSRSVGGLPEVRQWWQRVTGDPP